MVDHAHPFLPAISLPTQTADMPFLPDVLELWARGGEAVWRRQRRMADSEADFEMPSVPSRRI